MRAVLAVVLFGLGWAVGQALLQPRLPFPDLEDLSPKFAHLERAADDYTAVAIGSSRVLREFVPEIFDRRMAEVGLEEHSFNLGARGMRVPEASVAMDKLLALRPARLRTVIFEVGEFDAFIDQRNMLADREIFWHTWPLTRDAMREALTARTPGLDAADTALRHLRHFLMRALAVGRGRELVPALQRRQIWTADVPPVLAPLRGIRSIEEDELPDLEPFMAERRGWVPIEDEVSPVYATRYRQFRQELPEYFEKVRGLRAEPDPEARLGDYPLTTLSHLQRRADAAGLRLVFVIMPSLHAEHAVRNAHEQGLLRELVVMNDPARYPQFYEVAARWDGVHLTREASREFMERLMDELAPMLAGEPAGR